MSVYYVLLTWDDTGLGRWCYQTPEPEAATIAEAARLHRGPADYVVAVEDGVVRQLTQSEEAELQMEERATSRTA